MPEYSLFAQRLRKLRQGANLTQTELAEKLNLHRTAYTKYETDRACPDRDRLLILAELFGVSVDYLLGRDEERYSDWQLQSGLSDIILDEQELYLLTVFRRLTENQRQDVVEQARQLSQNNRRLAAEQIMAAPRAEKPKNK